MSIFCKHYFSPLNMIMRKGKNPDPYLWLTDQDPDPGGPKNMWIRILNNGCKVLISNVIDTNSFSGRWGRSFYWTTQSAVYAAWCPSSMEEGRRPQASYVSNIFAITHYLVLLFISVGDPWHFGTDPDAMPKNLRILRTRMRISEHWYIYIILPI